MTAIVAGDVTPQPAGAVLQGESVTAVSWDAERITLRTEVAAPALLVLADAFYPGWQVTVDGHPAPILRTNFMFRGISLDPGVREVVFTYAPSSWRWGGAASLAAAMLLFGALAITWLK